MSESGKESLTQNELLAKRKFFERKVGVKFELHKSDIIGFETPLPYYVI